MGGGTAASRPSTTQVVSASPQDRVVDSRAESPEPKALLDALEHQGIVARRPSEQDRRRNITTLTGHGWEVFRQAESRYSETERGFTATLGDTGAAGLRQALGTVLSENGHA